MAVVCHMIQGPSALGATQSSAGRKTTSSVGTGVSIGQLDGLALEVTWGVANESQLP